MMRNKSTPDELNFHPQYNKGALHKILQNYPAVDVKKGLQSLYKKAEKHFSEEEGLLQVVWRGLQEDVLKQVEKMNELLTRCYPDAGEQLEFTVQDVSGYFSEIAKSH